MEIEASGVHLPDYLHILIFILFLIGKLIHILLVLGHVKQQFFLTLAHKLIAESGGTDGKISRVIGQRVKHLTVGDTVSHHNVGRRMGLREHVFDLFAGPDIPVGNVMFLHLRLPLRFQTLTFSHALHDRKGLLTLQALLDQITHDIVSRTDGRGNRRLSFLDQRLRIAQPYVRTVGQTGNPDQIRKALRFRVHKHLHGKLRTELRNTQST